jgi:hypothetical protein
MTLTPAYSVSRQVVSSQKSFRLRPARISLLITIPFVLRIFLMKPAILKTSNEYEDESPNLHSNLCVDDYVLILLQKNLGDDVVNEVSIFQCITELRLMNAYKSYATGYRSNDIPCRTIVHFRKIAKCHLKSKERCSPVRNRICVRIFVLMTTNTLHVLIREPNTSDV